MMSADGTEGFLPLADKMDLARPERGESLETDHSPNRPHQLILRHARLPQNPRQRARLHFLVHRDYAACAAAAHDDMAATLADLFEPQSFERFH
jgi:hypothetical protein